MGHWVKRVDIHHHEYPNLTFRDGAGSIWECSCGQQMELSENREWNLIGRDWRLPQWDLEKPEVDFPFKRKNWRDRYGRRRTSSSGPPA